MNRSQNPLLKSRAQELRRNMTKEERHLWYDFLKSLPLTVHRQKVFDRFIADFYIAENHLVIELDGSQHFESEGAAYDRERDAYLSSLGLTVLRYSNYDVNHNFRAVCDDILSHTSSAPSEHLLLKEKAKKASPRGEAVERSETDEVSIPRKEDRHVP